MDYKQLEKKYIFTNDLLCMSIMGINEFTKALDSDNLKTELEKREYINLLKNKKNDLENKLNSIYNFKK